jgi:hypothetical protein
MSGDARPAFRIGARMAVVSALAAGLLATTGGPAPGAAWRPQAPAVHRPADASHRYRIVGKIRLLVVWVSVADVGGARVSWQAGERDHVLSLLIGSDPQRAPRATNQWGYVREHVDGDDATVFVVRTPAADGGDANRDPSALDLSVLCSTVSPVGAASRSKNLRVDRDVTYSDVLRVLGIAEREDGWKRAVIARPAGVEPGILTALDRVGQECAASARDAGTPRCPSVAYVYNDAIYDLVPRRVDRVAERRTPAGLFRNLVRAEYTLRNRASGWSDGFSVTVPVEGALAGVPVAAQYQPGWWFRVELELDEQRDVPADAIADVESRQRVAALCQP